MLNFVYFKNIPSPTASKINIIEVVATAPLAAIFVTFPASLTENPLKVPATTSAKAAITTACRGYRDDDNPDGIDVDIATYLSSLVPIERGISWSLTECFYGNEEKNRKPIKELINQVEQYPGLKEIAFGIEDLVVRRGQHASGVILYNNSPYDTTALMRSPNGDITTQFDLHKSESLGDVKFDFLVTDICDKISITL